MAHETESPNRCLGDFQIIREIGRGGMGVVYEARQVSLNRKVALKVLSGGLGLTPKAVQRFRREAEAAAKLHHTNIVPVYATGEENGTHFYAMELIDGPSLDHVIKQLKQNQGRERQRPEEGTPPVADASGSDLSRTTPYLESASSSDASIGLSSSSLSSDSNYFDTVARMTAEVADALDYAHQNGVIHRDMKPSNLLLSPAGRLSVNDFGLARMLEQPGMTMTGEFVGTPAYMSPEQITAGRTPLDRRTDIYSLGATMYELLTLHPPFIGERRDQVLAQILHKEPKPPRKVNPKIPVDLETICLKAMEKDPDRRYQTGSALAEDLRRTVNRFAISARRAGPVERLRKWIKRHPGLAAGVGVALLATMLAGFFAIQAWRDRQERAAAEDKRRQQMLLDKQQETVRDILMGDLKAAKQAVEEAVELGAPEEWVQWRQGQIAFHEGEWEEAIRLLEPAAAKMPNNLALHWMLARVCGLNHHDDEEREIVRRIDSIPPGQEEEYLYKGDFKTPYAPKEGLALFEKAIKERPSLVAFGARAMCLIRLASNQSNLSLIRGAMQDAAAGKRIVSDSPYGLARSLVVHYCAAILYKQAGQRTESDDAMGIASEDAEALKRFPDVPMAVQVRGIFLSETERNEEAAAWYEDCITKKKLARGPTEHYAWVLYELGQPDKAFQVLDQSPPEWRDGFLSRVFFAAESRDRGLLRARQICNDMNGGEVAESLFPRPALLFLLGQKEKALQLLAKHQAQPDHTNDNALYDRVVAYWMDPNAASEKELLDFASGGKASQVLAHWHIAIRLLADGDRAGARRHLEACMKLHYPYFYGYLESRALLARMNDPEWPHWIPLKNP